MAVVVVFVFDDDGGDGGDGDLVAGSNRWDIRMDHASFALVIDYG